MDSAFAYGSPALHGTCPSEKAKDWLGDSCEKGAAWESKQTFIIWLSIYSPEGCNTRLLAANALVTLCYSDNLAKQMVFCIRKQRPVSTADQGFSAFIFTSLHRGFRHEPPGGSKGPFQPISQL